MIDVNADGNSDENCRKCDILMKMWIYIPQMTKHPVVMKNRSFDEFIDACKIEENSVNHGIFSWKKCQLSSLMPD